MAPLSLNIDKQICNLLPHPQPICLKNSGTSVEQTAHVKFLGLSIDCYVNWKKSL